MTAPPALPILALAPALREALAPGARLVIEAPTGSGKSTQVPPMILDAGLAGAGQIVVLQPRRLAARLLARWVARQRGTRLGAEVGYQVRFDNRSGPGTRIKFETDGVLLRQLAGAPDLPGVGTIVFDEFHERHLFGDVMLAMALRLQAGPRPDLRLVVMSATLDTAALERHLAPCRVLRTAGRLFPVTVSHLDQPVRADREAVWDTAARAFAAAVRRETEGDVLVFMPGAYEIRRTIEAIRRLPAAAGFRVLPLHGELGPDEQDAAVAPGPGRKVVVATNVAETSITIDGVRTVIDSGLARKARFDPLRGINTLLVEKISRASAEQRAGRAGRTAPGHGVRLWTAADHAQRPAADPPEIRRLELSETVLALKEAGVDDLAALRWLDPPGEAELRHALDLLGDLGALDPRDGRLTPLGRRLQAFPLHPRQSRMLVEAERFGCVRQAAHLAALCQERSVLAPDADRRAIERRERALGAEERSDLLLMLRALRYAADAGFDVSACAALGIHAGAARAAQAAAAQLLDIAARLGLDTGERTDRPEDLCQCVLAGFSDQLGRRVSAGAGAARYQLVRGRRGSLDRRGVVRGAELIVASEVQEIGRGQGDVEVRLACVTAIEPAWLAALFPDDLHPARAVAFDAVTRRVEAREQTLFRDLVIAEKRGAPPAAGEAARVLAEQVMAGTLALKEWDHRVEQWIARVNLLARECPDLGLPAVTEADRRLLVEQVCLGATGYKDIKDKPVWPVVRQWLSAAQQALVDAHAPERVTLANGRTPRVTYAANEPPFVALRVQELFGVRETPRLAQGRVPLRVHILAPSQRPVQVTEDLRSFWANVYPRVKQELQRKYPKHEWR